MAARRDTKIIEQTTNKSSEGLSDIVSVSVTVNLAAYLEGGPTCAPVGTLPLRVGLAHVPIGPNSNYIQHSAHNIG